MYVTWYNVSEGREHEEQRCDVGVKYDYSYRRFFYRFRGFTRETSFASGLFGASPDDKKFL